jgi:RNA polymerase sigma factor (sigma-70 family)
MADDQLLLREYVCGGSRAALADLVQRHLALVYSAALRQVRDPHLAEDVTQAVFLVLVQKGATIKNGVAVGGWLLAVTRHAALNALKQRSIEQRRERMLAKSLAMKEDTQVWEDIAPHLDAELHRLSRQDRDAVVLRYFQDCSFAQIATELCVSEDAAQKRVSRALDRLRRLLTRRGITLPQPWPRRSVPTAFKPRRHISWPPL